MAQHYGNHFEGSGGTTVLTADAKHIVPGGLNSAQSLTFCGSIKALSTTSDVMRIIKNVPSNFRITTVWAGGDDASAAGAFDLGVYQTELNGGAVVDADRFGSALAKNVNAEVFAESTVLTPYKRGLRLWEILGLSADSYRQYDICATPTTSFTTTAAGITIVVNGTMG